MKITINTVEELKDFVKNNNDVSISDKCNVITTVIGLVCYAGSDVPELLESIDRYWKANKHKPLTDRPLFDIELNLN